MIVKELESLMEKPVFIAICPFAVILVMFVYKAIRCRFAVSVNCWFCNKNMRVSYKEQNKWHCSSCGQYNGFTEDGDYNVDIIENSRKFTKITPPRPGKNVNSSFGNRLCDICNRQQEIKVKRLASFDVDLNSEFDSRLEKYKKKLEEDDILCTACTSHVERTLNEKKKLIFLYKRELDIKQARSFTKFSGNPGLFKKILRKFCVVAMVVGVAIICMEYILKLGIYYNLLDETALISVYASYTSLPIKYLRKAALFIKTCIWLLFYMLGVRVNWKFLHNFLKIFKGSYYLHPALGAHVGNYWKLIFSFVALIFVVPIKKWFRSQSSNLDVSNSFHHIPPDNPDDSYETNLNGSFYSVPHIELTPSRESSVLSLRSQCVSRPQSLHSAEGDAPYMEINNNLSNNFDNESERNILLPRNITPPKSVNDTYSNSGRRYSVSSIHSPFRKLNVSASDYSPPPKSDVFIQSSGFINHNNNQSVFQTRTISRKSLILPSKLNVNSISSGTWSAQTSYGLNGLFTYQKFIETNTTKLNGVINSSRQKLFTVPGDTFNLSTEIDRR